MADDKGKPLLGRRNFLQMAAGAAASISSLKAELDSVEDIAEDMKRYHYGLSFKPNEIPYEVYTKFGKDCLEILTKRLKKAEDMGVSVNEICFLERLVATPDRKSQTILLQPIPVLNFLARRAAENNTPEIKEAMEAFLDAGGSINWRDRRGNNVLHALYQTSGFRDKPDGFDELEKFLIDKGANQSQQNKNGDTPDDIKSGRSRDSGGRSRNGSRQPG